MEIPADILGRMRKSGAAAGFAPENAEEAVQLARALLAGGVDVIELTLRTPEALEGLRCICAEVPEILVIAGTVLTPEQAVAVKKAGAQVAVAPGTNLRVVRKAQEIGLPFMPGITTPTELESVIEAGCRFVKFFPAEPSGGIPYLRSMAAPYKHLGIRYFPLGGLNLENIVGYLREDNVPIAGGSWLTKRELIKNGDWAAITARATELRSILDQAGVCNRE